MATLTNTDLDPLGKDTDPLDINSRPDPIGVGPDPDLGPAPRPDISTVSRVGQSPSPDSVLVCLDCETYYPDGDGWDYCPNCSARVFEVSRY